MPPKRRRTSGPSSQQQQPTLSFNRTTKPSASRAQAQPPASKAAKPTKPVDESIQKPLVQDITTAAPETETEDITLPTRPTSTPNTAPEAVAEPAQYAPSDSDSEDETEQQDEALAAKITDKQINAYWSKKEQARKAPRVHQAGLSVRERVLREFDMETKFGPSIGLTRLARYKRAKSLNLNPQVEVLAVLRKELEDGASEASRKGKGGKGKGGKNTEGVEVTRGQKSVMDELIMSSKVAGVGGVEV